MCKEDSQCIKRMVHVVRGRSLSGVFLRFIVNLHILVVIAHSKSITCSQRQLKDHYMKESVNTFCCWWCFLVQKLFCILVNLKSTPDEVALEINSEVSTMEACIVHSFHAHKQVSPQI